MARVLVLTHEIDADGTLANTLRGVGHDVFVAQNLAHMKKDLPAEEFDVVVAGLGDNVTTAEDLLDAIRVLVPRAQMIGVANESTPSHAIESVRSEASDCLSSPVEDDRLLSAVASAAAMKHMRDDLRRLEEENRGLRGDIERFSTERSRPMEGSGRRYLEYLEKAPVAVMVTELDGTLVDVYGATEKMTGFSRDELLSMAVLELVPPQKRDPVREIFQRVLLTGRAEREWSYLRKDGSVAIWLVCAVKISNERLLFFATDVTDQKKAESKLERSRQRLRTIMDAVPSLIFVKDASGRVLAANRAAADSVGMNVRDLVGSLASEVGAPPGDVERWAEQDLRVLESGAPLDISAERLRLASGETRWFKTIKVPYTESDFGKPAVLGISMDITDRVEASAELARNYETQRLLRTLLEISLQDLPLEDTLDSLLDILLSASFVCLAPVGGIFLMEAGVLRLAVHRDTEAALLTESDRVPLGESLWGRAAVSGKIEFGECPDQRHGFGQDGVSGDSHLAVPIMHGGDVLGVIVLYVKLGYERSEGNRDFLRAVAHTVAAVIVRKRAEELQGGQRTILELISRGNESLPEILATIVTVAEGNVPGVRSTILLLDGRTIRPGAGGSMPEAYAALLDGLLIGPMVGSCGTAMHRGERVIVEDVATDPLWANFRELGETYDFRACWSQPIVSSGGEILGSFALYRANPGPPTESEVVLVESMAHLAGLAIERTQMEVKLRKLGRAIEQSPESIVITDPTGDIEWVNPGFCSLTGYSPEEVVGRNPRFLHEGVTADAVYEDISTTVLAGGEWRGEWSIRTKGGVLLWQRASVSAVLDENGEITNFLWMAEDITDRKALEREKSELEGQLLQSQRMETIGTLAGGIAHDFNNVLTPIMGYSQLARERLDASDPLHQDLGEILGAARRAKALVEQILLFSRPTRRDQKPVKIQDIVEESVRLLRATIPTTISIRVTTDPGCDWVLADASQIHQVVLNLCTNAFQAMEAAGGLLEIELEQVVVDAELANLHATLSANAYARLSVRDSGPGMDEGTRVRIFEPFFTTKPMGRGTGLGLAVVHGIIQSHGGEILVESSVTGGSLFQVYLPITAQVEVVDEKPVPEVSEGSESILVVDDDPAVTAVVARILRRLGYDVTTFTDSTMALKSVRETPDRYQMVVSDLTMPGMTGLELITQVQRIRPTMATMIMTGYGEDMMRLVPEGMDPPIVLAKPIDVTDLATTVRRALDR